MKKIFFLISFSFSFIMLVAQNVGIGTANPNAKAALDVSSNNKGLLPPRITEDSMISMGNVANGMLIYNTSRNCIMLFNSGNWRCLSSGSSDKFQLSANNYFSGADSSTASEITDIEYVGSNYFVTGTFSGSKINLGNNIELAGSATLSSTKHGFVAKYDSSGKCIWGTKLLGGTNATQILPASIAVNNAGSVFITGTFNDSIYLYNANGNLFNKLANDVAGDYDIFIIKLQPNGNIDWRRREGNNGGRDEGKAIFLHGSDFFICGQFQGTQTFGNATQVVLNSAGGLDGFYVKYDTTTGTNCYSGNRVGGALGNDLISDIWTNGINIYVTGSYENSIVISTAAVPPLPVSSLGGSDMFVIKYAVGAGIAEWVLHVGGSQFERGLQLIVQSGQLYVAGIFASATTEFSHIAFLPQTEPPNISTNGSTDGMLFRIDALTGGYNQTGDLTDSWITTMGGTGQDLLYSLEVTNNFCLIAGEFKNKLEFANGYPVYSSGGTDGFVASFTSLTGDLLKTTTISSIYNDNCKAVTIRPNGEIATAGSCSQPVLFNGISSNKPFSAIQQSYFLLMK